MLDGATFLEYNKADPVKLKTEDKTMSEKELEMQNDYEPDRVTLTDEEGVEREFDIIGTLEMDGNEYFALVAADGNEDEYIVLKVVEENGEEVLITIDDDDEFDRVADAFDNEMMEEYDLDGNEEK